MTIPAQAARQCAVIALPGLDPEPTKGGDRIMNKTVPNPCMNGDGRKVHAQRRCKGCYERALAIGAILAGDGRAVVQLDRWSPDWTARALCKPNTAEGFFPEGEQVAAQVAVAKKVCRRCPVRDECLDLALSLPDVQGIWAGTDENERAEMRQVQRRAAA